MTSRSSHPFIMQPTDSARAGFFFCCCCCARSSVKFDSLFSVFISGLQHVHKALCTYTTQPGMRKSLNLPCQMEHVPNPSDLFHMCIRERVRRECLERGGPFQTNLEGDWSDFFFLLPVESVCNSSRLLNAARDDMRCAAVSNKLFPKSVKSKVEIFFHTEKLLMPKMPSCILLS